LNESDVLSAGSGQRAARINMWTTMMLDFEGANDIDGMFELFTN